jgi:hypothetical protein
VGGKYDASVGASTRDGLAERAGVRTAYVDRLVGLGILVPLSDGAAFSDGDVRRVRLASGLEEGGLPLEGIATAIQNGDLTFAFLDLPSWEWYGGFSGKTYRKLSAESGLGIDLLQALRESMGFARPEPDDSSPRRSSTSSQS